ncbi:GntR family transcriptional regulator [Brachybacterium sp. EF45031]|nr:GntR family transcriptional regulator [Brachybacterium sillae]
MHDPTPPYEQVRRQILEAVRIGALPVGSRLPTIRALARDLGLASGTIARAYKELEATGVLVTARGAGTRVAEGAPRQAAEGHGLTEATGAARTAALAPGSVGGDSRTTPAARDVPMPAADAPASPPALAAEVHAAVARWRSVGYEVDAIRAALEDALRQTDGR